MTLRTLLLVAALASGAARAEPRSCRRDKDCPGDQVCERNACVQPGNPNVSREQAAAKDAGMALLYTKNTWPESIADRPLMVAPGMTEVELNVDRDFSNTNTHPLTTELFARFGVSDRIHAVLDSVGLCLADCDPIGVFQFISAYLGYAAVAERDINLVTQFGFGINNVIDSQSPVAAPGNAILVTALPSVLLGWRAAPGFQIFSSAVMSLGFVGRDHALFPDVLGLHVEPRIQLGSRLTLAPFIGYILPFAHTEFHRIPVGVGLYFVPERAIDVGFVFQFLDLFSHNIAPATAPFVVNIGGPDYRSATVFVTFRL
jgi:hypothetical protein